MKSIAIITAGTLPVPSVKGGAVENLVENLIKENEKQPTINMVVYSIFDNAALKESQKYKYTSFIFIKVPFIVKLIDLFIYFFFTRILRKEKPMSYRYISSRIYYIVLVGLYLHRNYYKKIILENHATLFICLKLFGNYKRYYKKYLYHAHNEISGTYGCLKIIRNTPVVIGVSNYVIKRLKQQVNGFSSQTNFYVLRNKINREEFLSAVNEKFEASLRKKLDISNNKIVLFAGRMNKEKGIDILIKAWNRLSLTNTTLLIVGSYYFNSNLNNSSYELELNNLLHKGNNIKFTGYISYKDMPSVYDMAELVVLPSVWDDPAPLTVIEALTMGKPLITTYSGGIPEYATSENSILLKRDSSIVECLSKAIKEVIKNDELRHKLRSNALKNTKNWTLKYYFDDFISILKNLNRVI